VDWEERFEILLELLEKAPRRDHQFHDCVIGVSGGKDSLRQALWLREQFDIRPLLVCLTYPPEQVTHRGVNNLSQMIEHGFDVHVSAPAPGIWKKLMREAFFKFANWAKATELALFASVPQIARDYDIPMIMWGENPGLQLGDLNTLGRFGYDGNNLRNMNTLGGGELSWQLDVIENRSSLIPYQYPASSDFDRAGLQIIYLGWFLKDWSLLNNAKTSTAWGLECRIDDVSKTGDLWGVTSLDEDWVTLNQLIKYYKFGFGRVTDYANEAIRLGELSREEAIGWAEAYDNSCDEKYIKSFCDYIEISVEEFWQIVRQNVNRDLFEIDDSRIIPKFSVGMGL
jgi:N-acetyl sugar amidotransferase